MDGDFIKSLATKPTTKENKDKGPSKKPKMDFKDKKLVWQRVNMVYTRLTVPITQALMAVEGRGLLFRAGRTRMDHDTLGRTNFIGSIMTMDTQ
ncbi:UNVERIFIED_CONTAM: hypothetical protein Sradi_0685600 [Sesamum radiatum]|uniref:Uncharacterized protein n=1 Tax=Sesamum radiatum TaxID=300843 RepID=A0AAW2VNA4_SESRA